MRIDVPKNIECFDDYTGEEASYFLGLLFSDGSMRDVNNHRPQYKGHSYQVQLRLIDRDVIEHFVQFVGLNPDRISEDRRREEFGRKPYFGITTGNRHITKTLMNLGIVPDKTHKEMRIPEGVNKWAFLRGYLEGDGSITGKQVCWVSSSKMMALDLKEMIESLGFETRWNEQTKGKGMTVYKILIKGGVGEVIRFLNKIYDTDLPVMKRKYLEFERIKKEVYGNPEPSLAGMQGRCND